MHSSVHSFAVHSVKALIASGDCTPLLPPLHQPSNRLLKFDVHSRNEAPSIMSAVSSWDRFSNCCGRFRELEPAFSCRARVITTQLSMSGNSTRHAVPHRLATHPANKAVPNTATSATNLSNADLAHRQSWQNFIVFS